MAEYDLDPIFETRLEHQLRDLSAQAVRPFDAVQITRAAASAAGRGWRSRLPRLAGGWRPVLILAILAVSLIGVGIVGGFIKLTDNNLGPNPSYQPFSPLPTVVPSPGGPSTSPGNSTLPSELPTTLPTADGQATSSPPPTASPTVSPTEPASPTPSPEPTALPTPTPSPTPFASPTPAPVAAVTAIAEGDSHSCALAIDGRIFCWGFNDMGQMGDGTYGEWRNFATIPVVGIDDAVAISAGIRFSCAVRADGSVWCWGEYPAGDGASSLPVRVTGITDATAVTAGGAFACALRSSGQVACWGNNALGQLGQGSFDGQNHATPLNVVGIDDATQISAGWNHACAVRSDGSLWCWGGNGDGATGYGQLGDGTFENRSTPIRVVVLDHVFEVAAGGWSTCALTFDGETWCWGYGELGTLGDGYQTNSNVPVQPGISDARLVAVGRFAACVSRADQSVWCWGETSWGSETGGPATTPVEGNKSQPGAVSALTTNRNVLLIDSGGTVWLWGTGTNQTPERWPVGP
ncbi:MAG: hypothetical protein ABI725_10315 [Chloroflexota bacterium]